jgi:glycyl-tRNA synthetase
MTDPKLIPPRSKMEKLVSWAKRRGFVFPTAEIYGGLGGFWDFGPLGVELKNNIKRLWWKRFVQERDDVVGLDGAVITNPKVWEASGHATGFNDRMVECKRCHHRFKADEMQGTKCPDCGGELGDSRAFSTMFKTFVGPAEDTANAAYLRPETAQSIFVNANLVAEAARKSLPFGIAQIGKAFRNEITPGNFIFRTREFEQMEIEYFVKPADADTWFARWVEESRKFFLDLGLSESNLREHQQTPQELAHYAKATVDLEYAFPIEKGWGELMGVANRGDFDLMQHAKASGRDLQFFDDATKEKYAPYVIEPSFGVERAFLAFLLDAFHVVEGGRTTTTESAKEEEYVLRLHPQLAPVKVAVLPLSKKPELTKIAEPLVDQLRSRMTTAYDVVGSIGRRYRRQDEIGTPYCVTVDFESVTDGKVTVRDRDTMAQERIATADLVAYLEEKLR